MLCEKLTITGTDGTAVMTGKFNDAIRSLEELLKNHYNGQSAFFTPTSFPSTCIYGIDGTINSPDSFTGPIGKQPDRCYKTVNMYKPLPMRLRSVDLPVFPHPCFCAGDFNCRHAD